MQPVINSRAKRTFIAFISCVIQLSTCESVYEVKSRDGCPYTFDTGTYGIVYLKPHSCQNLLPENVNLQEPLPDPPPFTMRLFYTDEKDIFRLEVKSDSSEILMYEAWLTAERLSVKSESRIHVGVFIPDFNYELYCCDVTKLKTVARYYSGADSRAIGVHFRTAHFKWTPLSFKGRFVFKANILISEQDWYQNVTSQMFVMPVDLPPALQQDRDLMDASLHFWNETVSAEAEATTEASEERNDSNHSENDDKN